MFYCSDTLPLHHTLFYYVYSKLSPLKNFEVYNLTKSFYIGLLYMMIKQTSANFVFQHIWWRQLTRQYFQYLNGTLQQFFWAKPAKIHINCYHLKVHFVPIMSVGLITMSIKEFVLFIQKWKNTISLQVIKLIRS